MKDKIIVLAPIFNDVEQPKLVLQPNHKVKSLEQCSLYHLFKKETYEK